MWRYPDNTYRNNPPARVEYRGFIRSFSELTQEQRDEIGFNEAVSVKRKPFVTYTTTWEKGDDLIYRETVSGQEVDEQSRMEHVKCVIRAARDRLLGESDWTQLADAPLKDSAKTAWASYRRALRGVPQQSGFPDVVRWPEQPE